MTEFSSNHGLDWTDHFTAKIKYTLSRSCKVEVTCSKLGRANTGVVTVTADVQSVLQLIQQLTRALTHCMVECGKGYLIIIQS